MKKYRIFFGALRLPVDYAMTVGALMVAYLMRRFDGLLPFFNFPTYSMMSGMAFFRFALAAALILVLIFAINNYYSFRIAWRFARDFLRTCFLVAGWTALIVVYFFMTRQFFFSRFVLVYGAILTIVFVIVGRGLVQVVQSYFIHFVRSNVLFIGCNRVGNQLYDKMSRDRSRKIVGALADQRYSVKKDTLRIIGSIDNLENIIRKYHIHEIIQVQELSTRKSIEILQIAREYHLIYRFVPDLLEAQSINIDTQYIGTIPVLELKLTSLDGWGRVGKRFFDLIFGLVFLAVALPIMLVTSILIKIDSPGTILLPHRRVGEAGKSFPFLKFRTMIKDAHKLWDDPKFLAQCEDLRAGGPLKKLKNDPRITKVGRFLRKTSLDELPQLFSVVLGQMSLVGPRPHLPEEVAKYERHHKYVLNIKPGITGLAQISGRSDLDFEEEVRLDTYYIQNWSIWRDVEILLRTFGTVVFRRYEE